MEVLAGVTASIDGLTIANGTVVGANATDVGSPGDAHGGGILNAGTVALRNCIIRGNTARGGDGSVSAVAGGTGAGGGIYNSGTLTVTACELDGNSAAGGNGGMLFSDRGYSGGSGIGGGIFNNELGSIFLTNCTLTSNSALGGPGGSTKHPGIGGDGFGGGILTQGSNCAVDHCTLAGNRAQGGQGGTDILQTSSGGAGGSASAGGIGAPIRRFTSKSSIVAGNTAVGGSGGSPNGADGGSACPDIDGGATSQGFNLIGTTNCSSGWIASDLTGTIALPLDPLLGPLQNNGGPTKTLALLPGSAAIDAGNSGGTAIDQRGYSRPYDRASSMNGPGSDGSDIGAFELQLIVDVDLTGGGVVVKTPNQTDYAQNATVALAAYPATGWNFDHWSGDIGGTASQVSLVMTNDRLVTGTFTATPLACAVVPSGLISLWPGSGTANDIIRANSGTLANGADFSGGKVGTAFDFDGVNDYVQVNDSRSLDVSSGLTIEAWIKTSGTADYSRILEKFYDAAVGGNNNGFAVGFHTSGTMRFDVGNGLGSYAVALNPAVVTDGLWHHVAAATDGAHAVLYVDGVAGTAPSLSGFWPNTTRPLYIGRDSAFSDRFFSGLVDEVSIYNRALSATEVQAIYNAGSAGKCLTPLYITSFEKFGNNVNLSWLSQSGLMYRMQYNTDLSPASPWHDVVPDITATGPSTSFTGPVPLILSQLFLRVMMIR
jgi:hypothetical protein